MTVEQAQREIEQLREANDQLRTTIAGLIIAQRLLLDAVGDWTRPEIPNN